MQVYSLEPLAKTMAINSIIAYKNYISPHKGFYCPHRLLHGGDSCSDYVKTMLTNQSLTEALKSSIQRFQACTKASKTFTIASSNGFQCLVIPCCLPL
jgi:putative component of membrane protein insertase Oxa1/YidC/SpoIIIJ protein YidD